MTVAGSDWSYGGSILTFVFPELLFIAVAGALYVLYTKPHLVPGHRYHVQLRSSTDTAVPGTAATRPTAVDTDASTDASTGAAPKSDDEG